MSFSRRDMLKLGLGAAAFSAVGIKRAYAAAEPTSPRIAKKIPIGLQLYSVRTDCAKDLPGVIQAVGKMGYQGVEFAGYYNRKADELRKLLDDNSLKCCGTHTALATLTGDALKATVEFNKTLGNKYLIVPSLPKANTGSVEAIVDTAKLLTELAAKVKPEGMRVGYHAHGGDFKKFGDKTQWEIIFDNASPDVVMQVDLGNSIGGGGDPIAMLKKYPGRSWTIHLKEYSATNKGAVIGEGDVKWDEVFRICETTGNTEWYIVEQEGYSGTPMDCVDRCLKNLRKMGK